MKLTNEQLKKIIKEELENIFSEGEKSTSRQFLHRYKNLQDEVVYGLRERGFNANPSGQPQIVRIKGRDGKVVEFQLDHYNPNDFMGALKGAIRAITDADSDMSMRRKASRRRMDQGMQSVSIDDPMMERKRRKQ